MISVSYTHLMEVYAKQADMTLEEFTDSQGISQDDFDEQCQQYAEGKVKQNLIVQEMCIRDRYYFRNGSHYLRYEEVMEDFAEPTVNYIKISRKGMEVRKKGVPKKEQTRIW